MRLWHRDCSNPYQMHIKKYFYIFSFISLLFSLPLDIYAQQGGDFSAAIQKADAYYQQKDYYNAKSTYELALKIKPDDAHAKGRISEIIGILKAQMGVQADYDEYIHLADEAMLLHDYNKAIANYQQAAAIMPQEQYPKTQSQKAKEAQAATEKQKIDYDNAIQKAEAAFAKGDYPNALLFFKHAAKVDDSESYPKEQIAQIEALMKQQANAAQNYELAIRQGDQQFNYMKYSEALQSYEQALSVKPQDTYAQQQLSKTKGLLAREETYDSIAAIGDKLYMAQKYEAAIAEYEKAQQILPQKQYAANMISKVQAAQQKQAAAYAAQEEQYQAMLKQADKLMIERQYEDAIAKYQEALVLRAEEAYPQQQIAKAQALLQKKAEYEKLIAAGDAKYEAKQYDKALYDYYAAQNLKPKESYPQQKIIEIDAIINKQKALESSYKVHISSADSLFSLDSLQMAQSQYQLAADIKPQEVYPAQKLSEISRLLQEKAKRKKAYDEMIAKADKLFNAKKLEKARAAYQEASDLMPNAPYPKYKIEDINTIEEQARQQKTQADYNQLIAQADAAFEKKAYSEALSFYQSAQKILPKEPYPPQQIVKIQAILDEQAQVDKDYLALIKAADTAFEKEDYHTALQKYRAAHQLKTQEPYPPKQIAKIEKLLAAQQEKEAAYQALIDKGNASFGALEYSSALKYYGEAIALKPQAQYPQQKIDEIKALLAAADKQAAYDALIVEADKHFAKQKWSAAIGKYKEALGIKPKEVYPKEQIALIEKRIASAANQQQAYDDFITQADSLFALEQYSSALANYQSAQAIFPQEPYPPKQIATIEKLLAAQQEKEAAYQALIDKGDAAFGALEYSSALKYYGNALDLKPQEEYPKAQIAEINSILDKEKAYVQLITQGDNSFGEKEYSSALQAYKQALNIKPNEVYPQSKIKEIEAILQSAEALEKAYAQAIAQGDAAFEKKAYKEAQAAYTQALQLKPKEIYPQRQLERIAEKLKAQAELEAAYQKWISKADTHFKAEEWTVAQEAYRAALKLKAEEIYPKQQLEHIAQKLQSIADKEAAYAAHIAQGDAAMAQPDYPAAIKAYTAALQLFDKPYPKRKIEEAKAALAKLQADAELRYQAAVAQGDRHFKCKQWEQAIAAYQQALAIKPQAAYPQAQIDEIARILQAAKAAVQAAYDKWVQKGDASYAAKAYQEALRCYQKALKLLPEEQYPQQQIAMILALLDKASTVMLLDKEINLQAGQQKRFTFTPIPFKDRDNTYILLEIQHNDTTALHSPKLKLDFGADAQTMGGFSFKLYEGNDYHFYFINLSEQGKWQTQANDFIHLLSEKEAIKVKTVKIGRFK